MNQSKQVRSFEMTNIFITQNGWQPSARKREQDMNQRYERRPDGWVSKFKL